MTVFTWVFMIGFLAVGVWLWSFMFRGEKRTFGCIGCGRCIASGECVMMREERERQLKREMKKAAAKSAEKPQNPS